MSNSRSRLWQASGLVLAFLTAATTASAQTTAPSSSPQAAGPSAPAQTTSSGNQLDEIVVTAQKRSETLSHVPAAVVAVTGEKLAASGVSDIRSLDTAVTGVMFSGNGTVISPSIRGIGSTQYSPLGGPAVGMNLDGVPVDGMIAPNGVFYDIDRVEVLKGPQGTLYGRNATAGVININSKRPVLDRYTGQADAEFGNYNSSKVEGGVNLPLGTMAAFRLSGLYSGHAPYMSNGYNDANDYAVRGQLLVEPNNKFQLLVGADYFHQGGRGVADAPLPLGSRGTDASDPYKQQYYPNPSDARLNNHMWGVHAEATFDLGFGVLVVLPSYREFVRDQVSYQGSFRTSAYDRDPQESLEARLSGDIGPANWLVGGYLFNDVHTYNADYVNPTGCPPIPGFPPGPSGPLLHYVDGNCLTINGNRARLPAQSEAVFGKVTYSITDRMRLTGGLRYTNDSRGAEPNTDYTLYPFPGGPPLVPGLPAYPAPPVPNLNSPLVGLVTENTTGRFNNLSFKAGAEYDLNSRTLLYVNIASGYKSGGVNDGTSTTYRPEVLTSYEAGVRTQLFDNRLRLHLNGFYWDYKDHQEGGVYFVPPTGIVYQITSIPHGKIYGVDLEANWRPTVADTFGGQVSYLESDTGPFSLPTGVQSATGHPYVNSPKWTLNLNYSHRFDIGGWIVEPGAETHIISAYNTDFRFDPTTEQAGYHKTDVTVNLRPSGGHWYVGAYVRNIENKVVLTAGQAAPGAGAPQFWGFLSDPRTYGVRFGASF